MPPPDPNPAPQPQPVSDADIAEILRLAEANALLDLYPNYLRVAVAALCREVQAARRQQPPRWADECSGCGIESCRTPNGLIVDVAGKRWCPKCLVAPPRATPAGAPPRCNCWIGTGDPGGDSRIREKCPVHGDAASERRQAPPVAAGAPSQVLTAEDASTVEWLREVGGREASQLIPIIDKLLAADAAGVAGKGAAGAEAGDAGARETPA